MRIAVFLVFALVTATFAAQWSAHRRDDFGTQPCAGYLAEAQTDGLLVRINGTRFLFYVPDRPGGEFGAEPVEYLEVPGMHQQNRSSNSCARLVDKPTYQSDFSGCSCNLIKVSEVAHGVNKTGWELRIDSCPAPQADLVFQAYVTVTNVTSVTTYYDTMQYSSVSNFSYTSPAGALKFGVNIQGWNWTADPHWASNNSYLALPLKFGVRGHDDLKIVAGSLGYEMVASFPKYELKMNIDWGYVLDGQGAILVYRFDDPVTNLGGGFGDEWFGFDTSVSFCQPLPHDVGLPDADFEPLRQWKDVFYDPSLQIIFGDFGNAGKSSSSKPSWTVPVAIAVPLVVAAFVILVVVLTLTVPSFRSIFITYFGKSRSLPVPEDNIRPLDAETGSVSSAASPHESAPTRGWQAASHPIDP